ncbi:hypothetical protein GpartN1_g3496.t1 [Galdieria partita]|uniref:Myb-like domain-containing protein n=1 Tax=Galdieria partita TaxID=83374 RepID=A0A9C7PW30_9RHOD|nr:hypothetical protein GpartN1_g3496.t1 [Galdieria partita]
MQVTWLHNLGMLCKQIGLVFERNGRECLPGDENKVGKKRKREDQTDNHIFKEQKDGDTVKNNLTSIHDTKVNATHNRDNENNTSLATTGGGEGYKPLALVDTESEATDNENWVCSQQSKQSTTSVAESTRNSHTPRKMATRWRKDKDDDRLIEIVEQCLEHQTATTEKEMIDKVIESLGNIHSFQQVRNHYRRLQKENRLPLQAPV